MQKTERIAYIDIARAIAIIAIVLGHALRGASIYPWLYSFNVPLCILITGITFSEEKKQFIHFLKNKFLKLMIPYYAFSIISILIYLMIGERAESSIGGGAVLGADRYLFGMIWGNGENGLMRWNLPLWYLPMLFAMEILAFFIFRVSSSTRYNIAVFFTSILIAVFLYYGIKPHNLPFAFETVLYLFPFFCLGRSLSNSLKKQIPRMPSIMRIMIGLALVILGTVLVIRFGSVDYVSDSYRDYFSFFFIAALLSLGIILMSSTWNKHNRFMMLLGQNTLPVLLMHKFPIMFFTTVFRPTSYLMSIHPLIDSVVVTTFTICMCTAVAIILYHIAPWALGRKSR